jgi:hypothetical protein
MVLLAIAVLVVVSAALLVVFVLPFLFWTTIDIVVRCFIGKFESDSAASRLNSPSGTAPASPGRTNP